MENDMTFASRITQSNNYYDQFADRVKERTESRDYSKAFCSFMPLVNETGLILDIGCGAGEHLLHFKNCGFRVLGVEPSKEMRRIASGKGLEVVEGSFETLTTLGIDSVSGIWCAASLLHVPVEEIPKVFRSLSDLLKAGDPLFFTVRLGTGAKWDAYDVTNCDARRYIQLFSEEFLLDALRVAGMECLEKWIEDSTWGRPSQWISVVARKVH